MTVLEHASVCTLDCPDSCSLTVEVEGDRIVKVRGSDALAYTDGIICNKVARYSAEFVHGEAPVTLGLLREAHLSILPVEGTAWTVAEGKFSKRAQDPYIPEFHQALQRLDEDLPIAEFLRRHFAGSEYGGLRRSIESFNTGILSSSSAWPVIVRTTSTVR